MDTPSASSALCNILLVVVLLSRSALTLPALQGKCGDRSQFKKRENNVLSVLIASSPVA